MSTLALLRTAHEERVKLITDQQVVWDQADAEKRELTAEEVEAEQRMQARIAELDGQIAEDIEGVEREQTRSEQAARLAEAEARAAKDNNRQPGKPVDDDRAKLARLVNNESRAEEFLPSPEFRDLTAGTATDGAELVPTTLHDQLYVFLRENATVLNSGARIIRTSGGEQIDFPTVTSFSAAAIVAEGGTIGESDPQFGTVSVNAYKYGFLTQVSHELEQDEIVNLSSFLAAQGGEALGRGIGAHLVTGTGTGQPNGADNTTNANNVTAAGAAAITADELIDLQHALTSGYRPGAVWLLKDATVALIRKLKDSDGQYLWRPGLEAGASSTLLGSPVLIDDNMAAATTGNVSVLYGNFQRGYIVRFAGGVRVERSEHFAWNTDMATWRFLQRADGEIIDHNAIASLTQA